MREFRPYGSVRGARSNARPYRDSPIGAKLSGLVRFRCALSVMAGLVPAIHVERRWPVLRVGRHSTAWMPGTRPGMTESAALKLAPMGLVPAIHAAPLGRIVPKEHA